MFFLYWLWWYRYSVDNLTFDRLTVYGHEHPFWSHEPMFLWKCRSFCDKKYLDLNGTRTPNLRIHAECSNHLRYQWRSAYAYIAHRVKICNQWHIRVVYDIVQHHLEYICWFDHYLRQTWFVNVWTGSDQPSFHSSFGGWPAYITL